MLREKNPVEQSTDEKTYEISDSPLKRTAIESYVEMTDKSKIYKIIAIVIAVIGFIGGIVCGNVFKTATLKSVYSTTYEYTFNYTVMIGVWVGTLLSVLIYYGIGAILVNQESILLKLNQNSREQNQYLRKLNQENHNNSASPVQTNAQTKASLKDDKQNIASSTKNSDEKELKNGQVKCPHCGAIHTLKNCMRCGKTIFEDEK
ncbi:MAG: hypothetical protein LIO62_01800 [Clostridiales bacterium]|nr:hypothetical protein [Clostridiales bacterium]